MVPTSKAEGADRVARLRRRGFRLEYASMAWMTVEAAVAITAGVIASSIALVGFGLDSVIEFFAAAIVVWQLRGERRGPRNPRGAADRRHVLRARGSTSPSRASATSPVTPARSSP